MSPAPGAVLEAGRRAQTLVEAEAVTHALDQTAVRISMALKHADPLALCVMHGGLFYCGRLLSRLHFPLQLGYVHVARYRGATVGGQLEWMAAPAYDLAGREVLIIDDVLDEGETLAALRAWAAEAGAARVWSTVLVRKDVPGNRAVEVDFAALQCPNRYLVGCGMDYQGYWRNLPDIRALPADLEDGGCGSPA